ncbi:VWA domain-containing protein [Pseudofulvibacter geojedonensis]|uniref:VWA domain-containing protein n=1 Tax=Pseudofulvibacter geojedonensis TaxID=1123758 RepID=A0ABW3HXZ4_9FLAO
MLGKPFVYILLVVLLSLGVTYFQYYFKAKRIGAKAHLFAFLRFTSLFLLGLLLFNPKFKQTRLENIKPKLVVALDVSESVDFLKEKNRVQELFSTIKTSKLNNKFDIDVYGFGKEINPIKDSLSFTTKQTNIAKVFNGLNDVYNSNNSIAPTVLVTDGNQTYGNDYVIVSKTYRQPIYPVIIGDTVTKTDLRIQQVQHNKYAFLDNEFPLEVTLSYQGEEPVNQKVTIKKNNTPVYNKQVSFSQQDNTQFISLTLPATHIGKLNYTISIEALDSEENIKNNSRDFSIQVIDESTKVLIVSPILHPDIGALKKAIESNKLRKVTIVKPSSTIDINQYQLVILYQPNTSCKSIFEKLNQVQKNYWLIGGLQTNWLMVNSMQSNFSFSSTNQAQDYLGNYNDGFELYQQKNISIETFPPLESNYGNLTVNSKPYTLLYQSINGLTTSNPLYTFFENNKQRSAFLLGEGVWKWRAHSFLNESNFESFDAFVGKTVQFLASNTKKERLVVNSEDTYLLGDVFLEAQYFDKNYVVENNAKVSAIIKDVKTNKEFEFDFLFKGNGYKLDISNLPASSYEYKVMVKKGGLVKTGVFDIENFNIEKQFLNPNVTKLQQIATNTNNELYHINNIDKLFEDLANNENYKTIQKISYKESPLIQWKYLLAILLFVLSLEWFLRKYNGLI